MNKPLLIVYGKNELDISKYGDAYIYKLSSLKIKSSYKFKVLNNPSKLDKIADYEKKSYIKWIYSIGDAPIYRKVSDLLNFDLFLLDKYNWTASLGRQGPAAKPCVGNPKFLG